MIDLIDPNYIKKFSFEDDVDPKTVFHLKYLRKMDYIVLMRNMNNDDFDIIPYLEKAVDKIENFGGENFDGFNVEVARRLPNVRILQLLTEILEMNSMTEEEKKN